MKKVMVAEDESAIREFIVINLKRSGYDVTEAEDGAQALQLYDASGGDFDVVLLDIMMPEMDGITVCKELRKRSESVGIIMLTAKTEEMDKVTGLLVGADDYVTKPFNPVELSARVRSQLRRYLQLGGSEQKTETLRVGAVSLDDRCKEVRVDGELINLTPREYEILKLLMQHAGEVFRPEEIYRRVWQDEPYGSEGTVAVHIRKLREKTEITPAEPRYLKTVWGQGYKFEAAERRREP